MQPLSKPLSRRDSNKIASEILGAVQLHIWLELELIRAGLAAALTLSLTLLAICRLGSDRVAVAGLVATIGAFCVFATVSFGIRYASFLSSAFASMGLMVALASDRPSKHSL